MKDLEFMREALVLASKGLMMVAPNPMVGCVIVKDDKIVASGYHAVYGGPHAEVNAIQNLPGDIAAAQCTVYVTLEPCSHYGKTPPCAEQLIHTGFKKVVVACCDPNPLVAGRGIKKLKAAGIEVVSGVLEQEARILNKSFMTFFEKNRPFYTLKWAQSADGFISRLPVPANRIDNLITGPEALLYTHTLRSQVQAILVGKNTALADDPLLTTRYVPGKNPIRMLIDKNLEVPLGAKIFNGEAVTLVFNGLKQESGHLVKYLKLDFSKELLVQISEHLVALEIQSVLVEGGAFLLNSFLEQGLWDELCVLENPNLILKNGLKAPVIERASESQALGKDTLYHLLRFK